jgi:hypothetical protein
MERREAMTVVVPPFADESEAAEWWASEDGRTFLRLLSAETRAKAPGGSRLVGALAE